MKKKSEGKQIGGRVTVDELARMVAQGFEETATTVRELRAEMLDGFSGMQDQFAGVNATLNRIENRLTHVDDTLIADYGVRIKRLEEVATSSRG